MTADMIIERTATGAFVASLMSSAFTFHRLVFSGSSWASTTESRPDFVEVLAARGVALGDTLALMVERVAAGLGVLDEVLDRMCDAA